MSGKEIGSFDLKNIEEPPYNNYYITGMNLGGENKKYLHQGIGRECLKFHKKMYESIITCSEDNGLIKPDGSHLSGDGSIFVDKMKDEGIIFWKKDQL